MQSKSYKNFYMSPESQPWIDYKVGNPSTTDNWTNENCCPMRAIYHITHIENSISILKNRTILPKLVYDKSILNQDRILVNWLSPNFWWEGSRYGNVCFEFAFNSIIEGRSAYWVECMDEYKPSALRILLTKQDRSNDSRLIPYNPQDKSGPWWHDASSGIHYRNGHYTLEFMVEDEMKVSDAASISFVKHHERFCCVDPATCADKDMASIRAAGIFSAGVVINGINCKTLPISKDSCGEIIQSILFSYHWSKDKVFSGRDVSPSLEKALSNSWLSACYFRRFDEQRTIALLFESRERFYNSVTSVLIDAFGDNMHNLLNPTNYS
jgi:hypothetical protein